MFIVEGYNNDDINDGLVDSLFAIDKNYPYMKTDFYRSLSKDKVQKNVWLYNALADAIDDKDSIKTTNWYAPGFCYYSTVVLKKMYFKNVIFYDYDPSVHYVNHQSTKYSKDLNISHTMLDVVFDREFIRPETDLVINLSCSSMVDMKDIINIYPDTTLFAFMGSNAYKRGNINVFETIDKFKESTGLKNIKYAEKKTFSTENKFLIIGYKE